MKRKHLRETPVCPQERLVIISYTTGLSFALERIGPLAAIIITIFYLFALYLFALPNTPENLFASIYSESLIKTTCQHLLLLVGFDTLIYRKYYDTPPILVGHQSHHSSNDMTPVLTTSNVHDPETLIIS
jgi:sterol desaturase/sphingolipid hydroxylase (fatty acid hydroxylase superfamily)